MPDRRRKFLPGVSARFLAVAVILLGMAYVTYDTQRKVNDANDQRDALAARVFAGDQARNALKTQVEQLQGQVAALQAANARKDAEIKRLTALLVNRGIDPRPTPTSPAPRASATRSRTTTPVATPAPSRSPTPTRSPRPRPSPSPTCTVYNPVTGGCLA